MNSTATIEAVRKTVTVDCPPDHAFRVFTERLGSWWPLGTHSVSVMDDGSGAPETAVLEPRVGGRLYERTRDGRDCDWGRVLAWEPPGRLVLSWHPGRPESEATEVEVRFVPEGERTRVELEHRGWERLGERAAPAREGYDGGWPAVLGAYVDATAGGAAGSTR